MKRGLFVSALFLALSFCHPETVSAGWIYQFSGTTTDVFGDGGFAQAFEIVRATPVTTLTLLNVGDVTPGTCVACTSPYGFAAEFFPEAAPGPYDRLGAFTGETEWLYFFRAGAFKTPGTYYTIEGLNTGTLRVIDTNIPEPSTLLLMCLGCIVIGMRRLSSSRA